MTVRPRCRCYTLMVCATDPDGDFSMFERQLIRMGWLQPDHDQR